MTDGELIIAQISDTHIGRPPESGAGYGRAGGVGAGGDVNLARLDRVLERLTGMTRLPDLLLVTGDLADQDDEAPYRLLKARLDACPFPTYVALGNHDSRGAARRVFECADPDFFHYAFDAGPLRVIVLDTLEEGRHGGAFCELRAGWLRERLAEAPERPTLVALHHPPIDTGIDWLTTSPAEPWVARLDMALAGQSQVIAMVAGHVHRSIDASRNGIRVRVCPSIAAPLVLDLAPLDPAAPDGRALVVDGPPGFALHHMRGGTLTSHVDFVTDGAVLARFDATMQPAIAQFFAERP